MKCDHSLVSKKSGSSRVFWLRIFQELLKFLPLSLPTCRTHILGSQSKCLLSWRCEKNKSLTTLFLPNRSNIHLQDTGALPRAGCKDKDWEPGIGSEGCSFVLGESAPSPGERGSTLNSTANKTHASADLLKHFLWPAYLQFIYQNLKPHYWWFTNLNLHSLHLHTRTQINS